jgi:hypothetical protein
LLAVIALLAAAVAVVAIVVSNSGSPGGGTTDAGTTATGAATVQRRNLVATDTESGTLSYADTQTVYNRLSGTITWLPQIGKVIHPGGVLFNVDNKPVLLMDGSTPAFRELTASDETGPDVYELNKNLVKLGYNPDGIVVDDTWQDATTAGIDALQTHLGETETGALTLGQIVFLPGPQMVQTVDTTAGSTGGGSAASYTPPATGSGEFVDFANSSPGTTTHSGGTPTTHAGGTPTTHAGGTPTTHAGNTPTTHNGTSGSNDSAALRALSQTLRQQTAELKAAITAANASKGGSGNSSAGSSPPSSTPASTGGSGDSGSGDSGAGSSAVAVLGTSSTKLVVTVDLGASLQSEASIGEKVTVEMPDGSTQNGKVTAVSSVAQSSDSGGGDGSGGGGSDGGDGSGGSGSATVPVTIELDKAAKGGGLDQASVSVNFVQNKARNVLSVPVTALLATSGSTFAVQEVSSPHKLIKVTTGLFAAGDVEISGPGIHSGLRVTDSQG